MTEQSLRRIYSPIAVATWQTERPARLDGESDRGLAELERVRTRLEERVSQRANELSDDEPA